MFVKPMLSAAVLLALAVSVQADFTFQSVTYVGDTGDSVQGVRIRSDGTIVVAANVKSGPFAEKAVELAKGNGIVALLSPDGKKLLTSVRVAAKIRGLALDGDNNIYLAADADGAVKLDSKATKILWKKDVGGVCARIDAGKDAHCAALRYDEDNDTKTGPSTIYVFDPKVDEIKHFKGHRNTVDVCVDSPTKTVIHIGWRQANASDGKKVEPVQISYVRGCSYEGEVKYTLYDWSAEADKPDFINLPTNNMADTQLPLPDRL